MSANAEIITLKTENTLEESCAFEWKINKIFGMATPLRTPSFIAMENVDTKFYFEVWFQRTNRGSTTHESSFLQVILRKLSESSVRPDLKFNLLVSVHYSDGSLYTKNKSDKPITLSDFTAKTCVNVVSPVYSNGCKNTHFCYLEKNCLILKCKMFFYGHLLSPKAYHEEIHSLRRLRKITKTFGSFYQSNELSDVSIKIGDKTLNSHKFVLTANSPVFERMLEQDFLESKTGIITVSDFEPEIFECFLKFLYTGELEDKSFSNIKQLYSLADKYDVQILKEECIDILTYSSLNEEQIYDILQMGYKYADEILQTAAKSRLANHYKK